MCHWCLLWSLTATFQQIVMGQAGRIHYKASRGERRGGGGGGDWMESRGL